MKGAYLTRDVLRYIMTKHCFPSDTINMGLTCTEMFDFLCEHYDLGLWWKNRMRDMRIKDASPSIDAKNMSYCFACKLYFYNIYWDKHSHSSVDRARLCNECFGTMHIHTSICPMRRGKSKG